MTFRTLALGQKLVSPFLTTRALVVLHHRAQVFHDTVEVDEVVARRVYQFFGNADTLQRAIKNLVERLVRNILYLGLQVTVVLMQDGVNLPEDHLVFVFPQWYDAPFVDAMLAVGDDLAEIYLIDISQSLASWTGSLGRVERERVRSRVVVGNACGRAHQSFGEVLDLSALMIDNHDQSFTLFHRHLYALFQTLVGIVLDSQAVDDYLDVVVLVAVNLHALSNLRNLTVDAYMEVAFAS